MTSDPRIKYEWDLSKHWSNPVVFIVNGRLFPVDHVGGKNILAAWIKGIIAGLDGGKCPYRDITTSHNNGPTYARTFCRAWKGGFEIGRKANGQ